MGCFFAVSNWLRKSKRPPSSACICRGSSKSSGAQEEVEDDREDWMLLLQAHAEYDQPEEDAVDWNTDKGNYTEQQLGKAVQWIKNQKGEGQFEPIRPPAPDPSTLTAEQRIAFDLVREHHINPEEPL